MGRIVEAGGKVIRRLAGEMDERSWAITLQMIATSGWLPLVWFDPRALPAEPAPDDDGTRGGQR